MACMVAPVKNRAGLIHRRQGGCGGQASAGDKVMTSIWTMMRQELPQLVARSAVVALLITAPVLAMANAQAPGGTVIDHIQKRNSGIGLVLLMSLQR